jgi:hypothetical protein
MFLVKIFFDWQSIKEEIDRFKKKKQDGRQAVRQGFSFLKWILIPFFLPRIIQLGYPEKRDYHALGEPARITYRAVCFQ